MDKEEFAKRYENIGGKIEPVATRRTIRVNNLKISGRELEKRMAAKGVTLEKIPFLKWGYYAEIKEGKRFSLGATPEYLLGLYQLQETASQLPAEILDPDDKDFVLDMCAAPGAKTTQLAQLMNNKGTLIATDLKKERLPSLTNNLERLGITNTFVYQLNGLDVRKLGMTFSKILLDAPCSGNYVADREWFSKRDLAGIKRNAALQRKLLKAAESVLDKGGILVYSTCSLEPEEDEENIRYAVEELGLKIVSINTIGDSVLEGTRRLWPHKTGTQGFFVAKLRKEMAQTNAEATK
jgi:tRNA (cytosine40_48-C5)-methyltransferase